MNDDDDDDLRGLVIYDAPTQAKAAALYREASLAVLAPPPPEPPDLPLHLLLKVGLIDRYPHQLDAEATKEDARAAQEQLKALAPLLEPVKAADVATWLYRIGLGARKPPTIDQFYLRWLVTVDTCRDMPMVSFTDETRRRFSARRDKWESRTLPSDSDVATFAREAASPWLIRRRQCERVIQAWERRRRHDREAAKAALVEQPPVSPSPAPALRPSEPVQPPPSRPRPSHLTGRPLFESRKRAALAAGLPPPPEPESFDTYGELAGGR